MKKNNVLPGQKVLESKGNHVTSRPSRNGLARFYGSIIQQARKSSKIGKQRCCREKSLKADNKALALASVNVTLVNVFLK